MYPGFSKVSIIFNFTDMVRNYKRKTDRNLINEESIKKAIKDVLNKSESISSASRKYGLKRQTLQSRLKKRDPLKGSSESEDENEIKFQSKYTSKQVFTKAQEEELVAYVKKSAFHHFGLTYSSFRKLAYEFAFKNNLPHPSNWNTLKEASEDWLFGFLKRNPSLALRKPENISVSRVKALNKAAVEIYFTNLRNLYAKYNFLPKDVYNLDESGITTVLDTPKVK